MQPVVVELGEATEEVDDGDLPAQQPQRPDWNGAIGFHPPPPRIDGKGAVGRDPNHQETDQAQQVEVVLVGGFFGEESIGETEKEQGAGEPVTKP